MRAMVTSRLLSGQQSGACCTGRASIFGNLRSHPQHQGVGIEAFFDCNPTQ